MADAGEVKVKITAELDDLESKLSDAEGKVKSFADEAKEKGTVKLEVDPSGVESGTASAGGSISEFASAAVGRLVEVATAVLIVKEAFDALSEAVQIASAAEAAATQTALKTGETTTAGFQARSKEIQEFARDYAVATGDSSEEINKSLQKLYGYGFTGSPTEAILEPFHELSNVLDTDMVTATNLVESSQVHFGKTMEDNAHIADVWAKAITSSNLDPVAIDLKTLGMAAEEGGMSLEDTAAMLSVLSAKDLPDPTTTLRMGIMALSAMKDPVAEYNAKTGKVKWTGITDGTEALKKLGMSASSVKAEPLLDTLEKMHDAGASLSDFKDIFGARTGMLMSNIADNIDGIRELSDEMEHTTGITKVMSSVVEGEFSKSWDQAGQAVESIKEKIGTDLLADIQPLLDIFSTSGYDAIMAFIEGLESGDFSGVSAKMDKFAGELGKNIASQIGEAFDIARGAIKWDWSFLTGKTSLDAFLKPIEQIFRAEFGLMAAEMKLKMAEGSAGAINELYKLHDAGVTALAGLLTSVQMLAEAFSGMLLGAINAVADRLGLGFQVGPITGLEGGGGTEGGGGSSVPSGFVPSVSKGTNLSKAMDIASQKSQDFTNKADDATGSYIQSLYSYTGIIDSAKNKLSKMGYTVDVADAQIAGAGYAAQSWGLGNLLAPGTVLASSPNVFGGIYDYWGNAGRTQTSLQAGTGSFQASEWGTTPILEGAGAVNLPGSEPIPSTPAVRDNIEATDKNTYALGTNSEFNQRLADNIKWMGGLWGDYTGDLSKFQADVDSANAALEETKAGLKGLDSSTDQTSDKVNALGQSCKNCADANTAAGQQILGYLQGFTAIEGLGPSAFRTAMEDLGTMYQPSFAGPSVLYQGAPGIQEPARLGAIAKMTDAEYEAYTKSVLPPGTAVSPEGGITKETVINWVEECLGISGAEPATMIEAPIVADTTQADEAIGATQETASTPQTMQVTADTGDAEDGITKLGDAASQGKDMPIKLGGYGQAKAQIDDLTQDEYKYIYITTIKTTISGGGGGGVMPTFSGVTGGTVGAPGTWGLSGVNVGDFFSFQNEAFVPRPTLAVVGDRPGGEYVLSAERVQRMARGGGSGSVTINAPLNVYAPIYGVSDLEQLFDEHTKEIQQLIAQKQFR